MNMRGMDYILLFATLASFFNVDSAYEWWNFNKFHHRSFPAEHSDQVNTQGYHNEIQPFPYPSLMYFFGPRILKPSIHMSDGIKDVKYGISSSGQRVEDRGGTKIVSNSSLKNDEEAVNFNVLNANNSSYDKIVNVTGKVTEQTMTKAMWYIKTKFPEVQVFDRMYDPLSRLYRFRYFHSKPFRNQERGESKLEEREGLKVTGNEDTKNVTLNETETAVLNSSMLEQKKDSSDAHRVLRFTFQWVIIWIHVLLQMLFFFLIFVLVSTLLYLCQLAYCCSDGQIGKRHPEEKAVVKMLTV